MGRARPRRSRCWPVGHEVPRGWVSQRCLSGEIPGRYTPSPRPAASSFWCRRATESSWAPSSSRARAGSKAGRSFCPLKAAPIEELADEASTGLPRDRTVGTNLAPRETWGVRSPATGIRGYAAAAYLRRCADRSRKVAVYMQEYKDRPRKVATCPREYGDRARWLAAYMREYRDRPCATTDRDVGQTEVPGLRLCRLAARMPAAPAPRARSMKGATRSAGCWSRVARTWPPRSPPWLGSRLWSCSSISGTSRSST
jgi:hypothetical protein